MGEFWKLVCMVILTRLMRNIPARRLEKAASSLVPGGVQETVSMEQDIITSREELQTGLAFLPEVIEVVLFKVEDVDMDMEELIKVGWLERIKEGVKSKLG